MSVSVWNMKTGTAESLRMRDPAGTSSLAIGVPPSEAALPPRLWMKNPSKAGSTGATALT